jgi:type II secretory ATPase GspE/PulE/Tfp pilus assembly ATPase PilB-like protein
MLRVLVVFGGAAALWAAGAGSASAAEVEIWPSTGPFTRGSGFYLSPWKILAFWLLFLAWVQSTDWISRDAQALKLRWALWNPIVFFSFFLALLLFWTIPVFFVGLFLLLAGYLAPLIAYVVYRNKQVRSPSDKVLTPRHLNRWFARKMNSIGIKMAGAEDDPREHGPNIDYAAMGASDRDNSVNLLTARQSAGFMPSRELLDDAFQQRASHIMLDYTPQAVGVRYQIDGVWHDRSSLARDVGDPVLEVFKGLAALKTADRRSRQAGQFGVQVDKLKLNCKFTSQGTQTGERAVLQFDTKAVPFHTLEEIGMREKMRDQLLELLKQPSGLFVFSSLPSGGLTTTIDVTLTSLDRFTRNFVEVVDADKPHRDVENVHPTTYSSAAGETPAGVLPALIRTYPDVIVARDVAELETLSILVDQAGQERLAITSTRAKEAVEALLRLMMLKIPPAEFAPVVIGVLNVRLVRKLCEKCKEAYPPPPEVLKQLGLPAGRIENLYRPPTQPINPKKPDEVCDVCSGIGYFGRTAIFELLTVGDGIRQVLTTAPKLDNLRAAARKAKHRSLQEEGVLLVARGVTSIQELLRVLKQ